MPRSIQVATIQMDNISQSVDERLQSAASLIADAKAGGATLIVLPALFNTGKTFLETNYEHTERLSDSTMQWMCQQAQQHQVHLVGSWMVVDKDDTYHTAFLIAPDGTQWRYDQQHPQLWERVFYRDGSSITVADTTLGKIGFLIGWDIAHPDIWERYAAKVDLLLVLHSELDYKQAQLQYADGVTIQAQDLGYLAKWLIKATANYLEQDIVAQGQWLRVPIISAGLSGNMRSILPAPFFSVQGLLLGKPELWERADAQYADMTLTAPFYQHTQIHDANGKLLSSTGVIGDAIVTAEITLADKIPLPVDKPQPTMHSSDAARFMIDVISGGLMTLTYRRGVRRQWGARMAPKDHSTHIWVRVVMIVAVIAAVLGRLLLPSRR
ncbi:MAG: carbon-nitrogen hydrolase family protein [Phototrophicaceae bacterium]